IPASIRMRTPAISRIAQLAPTSPAPPSGRIFMNAVFAYCLENAGSRHRQVGERCTPHSRCAGNLTGSLAGFATRGLRGLRTTCPPPADTLPERRLQLQGALPQGGQAAASRLVVGQRLPARAAVLVCGLDEPSATGVLDHAERRFRPHPPELAA